MKNYTPPLEPDNYYHIYNHAVGQDNLFNKKENYHFFLEKYASYINPVADTFAYCLLPNHFHFLVRIKEEIEIEECLKVKKDLTGFQNLSGLISKQFSNLFNSYSKSFNRQQYRKGALFERPFKRRKIDNEKYLKNIIHYIHYNPVHHEFTDDLKEWKYSSYNSFFTKKKSLLKREEVIEWFDNLENFIFIHNKEADENIDILE